jgi:hypothetical protein
VKPEDPNPKNPAEWFALKGTMLRVTQDSQDAQGNRELLVSVISTPCVVEKNEKGELTTRNDRIHIGVGALTVLETVQSWPRLDLT